MQINAEMTFLCNLYSGFVDDINFTCGSSSESCVEDKLLLAERRVLEAELSSIKTEWPS